MPTVLTNSNIMEKGTAVITATFTDEDGNSVNPDTMTWTLSDEDGTIINSREDIAISSPSSSEEIVLSGADLQILSSADTGVRILTLEGTYTSDAGAGLPIKDKCRFVVQNLEVVS